MFKIRMGIPEMKQIWENLEKNTIQTHWAKPKQNYLKN